MVKINKRVVLLITSLLFVYTFIYSLTINQFYKNGGNLWKAAVENHPNRATYWVGYGFYYYDNKEYPKAAECVTRAIKLKPKIPEYYHKAALAYEKAGDLSSANKMLKDVLAIESEKSITLFNLAKNYILLDDFVSANKIGENIFNGSDSIDKIKKADLLSTLSYYFAESGQYDYSIKFVKTSINDYPNNSDYYNNLGVFYLKKEMPDSAKIFFEKALTLEPSNKKYQSNLLFTNNQIEK